MKLARLIKKYYRFFFIYSLGAVSAYVIYELVNKIATPKNVFSILKDVLSYSIYAKGNNPITLGKLFIGVSLIIAGYHLSKFVSKLITEKVYTKLKLDRGAISAIENLTFYCLLSFFTLFALNTANFPLELFTFFGGALAIGIGFGSQNIINNFISGVIILIERPLKVGDLVEIEGTRGVVEHIGARRAVVRSTNGTASIFPNSFLLDKKLVNYTYSTHINRCDIKIVIPVQTDLEELRTTVLESLKINKMILSSPAPAVALSDFLDAVPNAILTVSFWIDLRGQAAKTDIESDVRMVIHKLCLIKKNN